MLFIGFLRLPSHSPASVSGPGVARRQPRRPGYSNLTRVPCSQGVSPPAETAPEAEKAELSRCYAVSRGRWGGTAESEQCGEVEFS